MKKAILLAILATSAVAQVSPPNNVSLSSVSAPATPASGANPTATISSTVGTFVNGSATTFMRSDAAPTLPATVTGMNSVTSATTSSVSIVAAAPAAAASSAAGNAAALTASAATAGTTNAGAAAGGGVTITAGNAARLTSGNAAGGNVTLSPGSGIGTGAGGSVAITGGNVTAVSGNLTLTTQAGNSNLDLVSSGSGRTRTNANFQVLGGIIYPSNGNGQMQNNSDGVFLFMNNGATDFGRFQLGGTTSSFPAIKRSAAKVALRLADDSADAGVTASTADLSGKVTTYNNVATAGQGTPAIYGANRATAQTGANSSIATYTVGAADASFIISANVNVTASATHTFSIECAYTDEGNTARVVTFNVQQLGGTLVTAITNVTGAGPYEGVPLHIRAKASTSITIRTNSGGTYTSVTYNAEGVIQQIL